MNRASKLFALAMLVAVVLAGESGAQQAGIQGSSSWGEQYPFWCTQAGDGVCRYYSDPQTPEPNFVTGCGGLYWFHTHYYVLSYCGEIPWP